jgi:hypothetical protein
MSSYKVQAFFFRQLHGPIQGYWDLSLGTFCLGSCMGLLSTMGPYSTVGNILVINSSMGPHSTVGTFFLDSL